MAKKKNPLVFMDVCIDRDPAEKMVFELFFDRAPKTADNFRALCTGEKGIGPKTGKPLHFKGSFFHRILKGYYAQGGDFVKRDGTGGESIYSEEEFPDESSKLKHNERGLLSMPVTLRDSLGSQFIITFEANHNLDRKHVIFGKLTHGWGVLKRIENAGDIDGNPTVTVKVINCGEYSEDANSHDVKRKGKHKKSSKDRRKRRMRRYESESDSDFESESSESDSAESDVLSSSYASSSSDEDKRKKRKRSYKRDKYKRAKRRDKGRDKKRRRRDKRSKIRSRRASDSLTNTEGDSNPEDGGLNAERKDEKSKKEISQKAVDEDASSIHHKRRDQEIVLQKENAFPKENGEQRSNGLRTDAKYDKTTDRQPDSPLSDSAYHSKSANPPVVTRHHSPPPPPLIITDVATDQLVLQRFHQAPDFTTTQSRLQATLTAMSSGDPTKKDMEAAVPHLTAQPVASRSLILSAAAVVEAGPSDAQAEAQTEVPATNPDAQAEAQTEVPAANPDEAQTEAHPAKRLRQFVERVMAAPTPTLPYPFTGRTYFEMGSRGQISDGLPVRYEEGGYQYMEVYRRYEDEAYGFRRRCSRDPVRAASFLCKFHPPLDYKSSDEEDFDG